MANEELLNKMISIIKQNPGIRPSELNRRIGLQHTAWLRNTLIKRGLVRKEKRGGAVFYYSLM